jgi:hypothetical protein
MHGNQVRFNIQPEANSRIEGGNHCVWNSSDGNEPLVLRLYLVSNSSGNSHESIDRSACS